MRFLCAVDETGSVKEVICSKGADTSKADAIQPESIKDVCADPSSSAKSRIVQFKLYREKYIVSVRQGGAISVYDAEEELLPLIHSLQLPVDVNDKCVALVKVSTVDALVIAFESGKVFIIPTHDCQFDVKPIEVTLPGNKNVGAFSGHDDVPGVFAYGGKENDVKVIKLFPAEFDTSDFLDKNKQALIKPDILFAAENVKNDHLDMRVPVWITKILFFSQAAEKGFRLLTATGYGQVRIYDTVHGKRPVHDYKICDRPIKTLTFTSPKEDAIMISDTLNLMAKYSLTKLDMNATVINSASAGKIVKPSLKQLGKYSSGGNSGALNCTTVFGDLVAAGGLDRYLRVFEVNSRDLIAKVYLGLQISDIVSLPDFESNAKESTLKLEKRSRRRNFVDDAEEEDIWKQLDENESSSSHKKKKKLSK